MRSIWEERPRALLHRLCRAVLWLAVVVLASCGKGGGAGPTAPKGAQFRLRDFHFKSGLRIVAEEDHSSPVVGVVNVVGVGSTSDPPGKEGLAHLVEHLTFRAKPQPGRTMWGLFIQAGAGHLNATTNLDSTVYYEFGPRDATLDLLMLEGIRMADPLAGVDEATFAVEREVVRNELRQRGETVVDGAVWAELLKATYPTEHAYSRAPIGSHESLDALTLADAQAFVKQHYRPSNMTMVLTGDLALDRLDKILAQALPPSLSQPSPDSALTSPRLAPQPPEPPEPPPAKGLVTIEGMVTAPELYLSWSLPRSYGETSHLARLAAGGLSSAVEHAVTIDNDVIGGSVELSPGTQAATVIVRVLLREGSHPEKSAEYVRNGLVYNWLPNSTPAMQHGWFERRIARIATLMLFESEDIEQRAVDRAPFTHFTGDAAFYGSRMNALNSIGPSQLEEFYVRYLNRDRARAVLVRPIPPDRQAPAGRVGIAETKEALNSVKYDVTSLRKLAAPVGLAQSFHRRTLGNGLVVETARRGTIPIVTIGLAFRGGMAEESESGAATMAWQLATPGRPLHGRYTDYGALLTRFARTDGVFFRVGVMSSQLDRVLAILADQVSSLRVRNEQFDEFDRYELAYVRRQQERPEVVGNRDFRQALFGSHVFAHLSHIPSDRRPDRSAANHWLDANITPARGVLAIVGDIDPEEALRFAESAFGGWSGEPSIPDPAPLGPTGSHSEIITHRPGATQAVVRVGCRLPTMSADDAVYADILSIAIATRIGTVRKEMGTTYGLSAWVEALRGGTGVLHVGGAVENAGLALSLRTIREEIAHLATLKRGDLDRGRWMLASDYNLGLTTTGDWVSRALEAGKRGWSLESIDHIPEVLASPSDNPMATALRACASEGVLSIVGDQAIAARAIAEGWLNPKPEKHGTLSRQ